MVQVINRETVVRNVAHYLFVEKANHVNRDMEIIQKDIDYLKKRRSLTSSKRKKEELYSEMQEKRNKMHRLKTKVLHNPDLNIFIAKSKAEEFVRNEMQKDRTQIIELKYPPNHLFNDNSNE